MTTKNNTLKEVRDLMAKVIKDHDDELKKCQNDIEAAKSQITTAMKDMDRATAESNADAYSKAKSDKAHAEDALEMFEKRLQRAQAAGYVDDKLSDATIQKLFYRRDELDDAYFNDAKPHILALMELSDRYNNQVDELRAVFNEWTTKVHKFNKPGYSHPFQTAQLYNGDFGIALNGALDAYKERPTIMQGLHREDAE